MRNLQTVRQAKPAKLPYRLRRSPACDHTRTGKDVPVTRKRRLTTSRMSAGVSAVAVMQKRSGRSKRLQGREPCHSRDMDSGTEDRLRKLPTGLPQWIKCH
jgi:hypothetical protein